MTKEFKVGDRVAVYGICINIQGDCTFGTKRKGVITQISSNPNYVRFKCDQTYWFLDAHTKQCRRLKPSRKPREFELSSNPPLGIKGIICFGAEIELGEKIRVREVLSKGEKK